MATESTAILYEHADGRRAVVSANRVATFAIDNPDWHRAGPVEIVWVDEPAKALGDAEDTARLDWLIGQDNCVVNEGVNGFWLCWIDEHDHARSEYQPGSFPSARSAIDAARALSPSSADEGGSNG